MPSGEKTMTSPIVCACTNLKMAARAAGRHYDEALAPAGINSTQYAILANIERRDEIASMELARLLMLERTTLYRALAILRRRGLISFRPGKGREQFLSLTAEGRALHSAAEPRWEKAQQGFTARFGEEWPNLLALLGRAGEQRTE
jgi:DNA-binding MarR family transcriptional regulator